MHSNGACSDVPEIDAVPRAFCKDHCAAWNKRKSKRGVDESYCGKTVMSPEGDGKRRCHWGWKRIREKMRS
jgi:hypothetical protein